jgi:thymidine phosphorylase
MDFSTLDVIAAKRDGRELSDEMISWTLAAYGSGEVAEEQMSALLMAIFFQGLSDHELRTWTDRMIASGERLNLRGLSRPTVDKHSTGGVGDKISLILAPLVASCGAAVPQLSGRGLGHTGGTLDKLESIPGWRAQLTLDEIREQLESVGAVICAAGASLAPVDRRLYALRDVTSTVESIPLISSSIMSKKIAEGTEALVLDVKFGRGAFIKHVDTATELAHTMVRLGLEHDVKTVARLTPMWSPLGRAVGNALEVNESVEVLRGGGPRDVRDLTVELALAMCELVGISADPVTHLDDGTAYEVYRAMIAAQGGDPDAVLSPAPLRHEVLATESGIVHDVDALKVGVAAWRLGAGRSRKEDTVSAGAGVICLAKEGETVEKDQPLFELYADDETHLEAGLHAIDDAVTIRVAPYAETPVSWPLIRD